MYRFLLNRGGAGGNTPDDRGSGIAGAEGTFGATCGATCGGSCDLGDGIGKGNGWFRFVILIFSSDKKKFWKKDENWHSGKVWRV